MLFSLPHFAAAAIMLKSVSELKPLDNINLGIWAVEFFFCILSTINIMRKSSDEFRIIITFYAGCIDSCRLIAVILFDISK